MTDERLADALAERYLLEEELGRGSSATVYLAQDLRHGRRVALKVLHSALGAALGVERFQREIRTKARLHHPHILPLFDSGSAAGRLYYMMPYVETGSLRDRLRGPGRLSVGAAVQVGREVGAGAELGPVPPDLPGADLPLQLDQAVATPRPLLTFPSWITPAELASDPLLAPLREHPGFASLIAAP